MQAMILEVTDDNFQEMVVNNSYQVPVLLTFHSPESAPCKNIIPQLDQLANTWAARFILGTVNVDQQPNLKETFRNQTVPDYKVLVDGQVVKESNGAIPFDDIKALLEPYLKAEPSEEIRLQAKEAFHREDYDQVVALLSQAAKVNPNNYRIHLDLVTMYLHTGNRDQAESLFDKLPDEAKNSPEGKPLQVVIVFGKVIQDAAPLDEIKATLQSNPSDPESLYGLTGYLMVNHAYEDAFKTLLKLFMTNPDYRDGIARKTLIELFDSFKDMDAPLVNTYRRKFQSLMF